MLLCSANHLHHIAKKSKDRNLLYFVGLKWLSLGLTLDDQLVTIRAESLEFSRSYFLLVTTRCLSTEILT